MPEGDTVNKLAAALALGLRGVEVRDLRVRRLSAASLVGRRVLDVRSKGKHLFIELDDGRVLRSHLGMYGSWHRYPKGVPWRKPTRQASVVIETEREWFVCFNAREVEILSVSGYRLADAWRRLGPDLTVEHPDPAFIAGRVAALAEPKTPLVDLLLDQRVACGIGNVYKCEVLFLRGQYPLRAVGEIPADVLTSLYALGAELLQKNLGGGARVTRFVKDGRGDLWVYGRAGSPCFRCEGTIRRDLMGSSPRVTYWCPACQAPRAGGTVIGA